jgi:hypothetical protein
MTGQPPRFVAGRKFEDLVKADFALSDGAQLERRVVEVSGRRGRADIWVVFDRSSGGEPTASAIFEVKATSWDLIAPLRMRPNLLRMARQLWRYMDAAIEMESQGVQAYLVFPTAPVDMYVRRVVEMILAERGIVTLWWAQQETTPDEFMDAGTDGSPDALTILGGLAGQFLSIAGRVPPRPPWLSSAPACRRTPVAVEVQPFGDDRC